MEVSKSIRLNHRVSGRPKGFTFKRLNESHETAMLAVNYYVNEEKIEKETFIAPTVKELTESLKKDFVVGAFHGDELVAFMILIHDRDTDRELSRFIDAKKEDCLTFDVVEVKRRYRGYGLAKEFIKIARQYKREIGFVHLLAAVGKFNVPSMKSFKRMSFKVVKNNIIVSNVYRELLDFVI